MLEALRTIIQAVNSAEDMRSSLDIIVERISEVMSVEVCTVYLTDDKGKRLVFMANQGLNPALIGNVSMSKEEGMVGLVATRGEPLNTDEAEKHPSYYFLPDSGEEHFHSFLGVPIVHQREVLGVLVVQQQEARRFDEDEEAFLITVSAQIAGVIAHARLRGSVTPDPSSGRERKGAQFRGTAGASGVAIGQAVVVSPLSDLRSVPSRQCANIDEEIAFFHDCLDAVREDMQRLSGKMHDQLPPQERALFDVYLAMLDDRAFASEVDELILQGEWAQGALSQVMLRHIRTFEAMEDAYLQERATDVKDLGRRVLAYLQASNADKIDYPKNTILVAEELTATMLGEVPSEKLVGLVSVIGSSNSHVAILARAMGVPTVMGAVNLPYRELEGKQLIVDGYAGMISVSPAKRTVKEYRTLIREEAKLSKGLEALRDLPCETKDGEPVSLWVNTGLAADVARSLVRGAEGVGLYRTEIPFMMRERFPSEEEQRQIYREMLEAFAPLPVTMRTLDVGGDKPLPYFPIEEANPFLGWRGIRITLDHQEIFLQQIRAMLKASKGLKNLRIMLPMISNVTELESALLLVYRAYDELVEDGWDIRRPPVGVMIEVPSAVYQARQLARRVDFLSVGSNDLTQYLLAVDRNNPHVADLYHSYHPAVLAALAYTAASAKAENKPVGICGELAGDPGAALLLMAMGFDNLSMSATSLLRVKSVIRGTKMKDAKQLLKMSEMLETSDQVAELLRETLENAGVGRLLQPQTTRREP